MNFSASRLLLLLAVICFALATLAVGIGVPLVPLGLALFAGSFLTGG